MQCITRAENQMKRWIGAVVGSVLVSTGASLGQAAELFPFVMPWDDATPSVANVSHWNHTPAGAKGFVTARDAHLFVGDERIRFFGVNLCFGANFPPHDVAEKVAARMAKFGINCVRFHHMDNQPAPAGIWDKTRRAIDAGQLDRLDYFIAQLKKHGIYTNINLHVSREYPDMPKWPGMPGYFKGVDNFYPPMVEMQKQFARDLLLHKNPHTGLTYAEDPAIAFVEINNENGLICEWWGGSLDGMPDVYVAELTKQWNAWLTRKYADDAALASAWNKGATTPGDELLRNGDFAAKTDGWHIEQHGTARQSNSAVDGVLSIDVATPAQEAWHVQFSQSGLKLTKGQSYTVRFRAKADAKRTVSVGLAQSSAPWEQLGSTSVTLTDTWQDIAVRVTANNDEPNGRLILGGLGATKGRTEFANFSLRTSGTIGLPEGESLGAVAIFPRKSGDARTPAAHADWMHFLWDTEAGYWTGMSDYLKQDLGVKAVVVGSATGFSPPLMQAKLDAVDVHGYWQHPSFPRAAWSATDWTVNNVPMTADPRGGTITWMTPRRVAGKPFLCTEYNASAPNTYSSEAFLLAAAYASLHDWDGFFPFAYSHRSGNWDQAGFTSFFDIDRHPTKMATLPIAAAMFRRQDVSAGAEPIVVSMTEARAIEETSKSGSWWSAESLGVTKLMSLRAPVAIKLSDTVRRTDAASPEAGKPVVSTTSELNWNAPAKHVTVDTKLTKSLIGAVTDAPVALGGVTIHALPNSQNWAAIAMTVMEGDGFDSPAKILLVAAGNVENAGMQWKSDAKNSVGRDWGTGPAIVEGVSAKITLPVKPTRVKVWTLDERGHRRDAIEAKPLDEHTLIEIGPDAKTIWYEIVIE
jgi:hypothetical protein